jgi:hypothetical protein
MMFTKNLLRKVNQFRKQNWSAPTIMTVFIITCMIIIFSFESLGLANKEKNLEFRYTTPEKSIYHLILVIRTVSESTMRGVVEQNDLGDLMLIQKLKVVSEKNKEDHIELMMRILFDGANSQNGYLAMMEENEFYDI